MGAWIGFSIRRGERPMRLAAAMMFVVLVCTVVIESLHGHDCAGDGCVLCFAAALAHVLLFACVGVALSCSIVQVFVRMYAVSVDILPRRESRHWRIISSCMGRVELTPVTAGVSLVI